MISSFGHVWRICSIGPLGELSSPPRISATLLRLLLQAFLVVCLWRGLYAGQTGSIGGFTSEQAVSYAVMAVLASRIRGLDRRPSKDTVLQHMQFGTIVYWFLRPVCPRRYYMFRAFGDQLYGAAWVLVGYLVCVIIDAIALPPSGLVAAMFTVSLILGQIVLYYIFLIIDLMCFWTLRNDSALLILQFLQNLLAGAYAPLAFFPGWFVALSWILPFHVTLNVPLSIYVGAIAVGDVPLLLAVQLGWIIGLAALTRWLWSRTSGRVLSQGG
jgi:viologen exporter family transport system permease protein